MAKKLSMKQLQELNGQYVDRLREMSELIEERDRLKITVKVLNQAVERKTDVEAIDKLREAQTMNGYLMTAISVMWHLINPHDPHFHPMDKSFDTPRQVEDFIEIVRKEWKKQYDMTIRNEVWNEIWTLNYDKKNRKKKVGT